MLARFWRPLLSFFGRLFRLRLAFHSCHSLTRTVALLWLVKESLAACAAKVNRQTIEPPTLAFGFSSSADWRTRGPLASARALKSVNINCCCFDGCRKIGSSRRDELQEARRPQFGASLAVARFKCAANFKSTIEAGNHKAPGKRKLHSRCTTPGLLLDRTKVDQDDYDEL